MEEQKSTSGKRDKKTTQISFCGGDGIGGLVLFGGALAVAGLIAVFTIKKRRSSKKPSGHGGSKESKNSLISCKKEMKEVKGCAFFLQLHRPPFLIIIHVSQAMEGRR
ncbi:hypothetical protein SLA2020_367740 [Shorea laevis]